MDRPGRSYRRWREGSCVWRTRSAPSSCPCSIRLLWSPPAALGRGATPAGGCREVWALRRRAGLDDQPRASTMRSSLICWPGRLCGDRGSSPVAGKPWKFRTSQAQPLADRAAQPSLAHGGHAAYDNSCCTAYEQNGAEDIRKEFMVWMGLMVPPSSRPGGAPSSGRHAGVSCAAPDATRNRRQWWPSRSSPGRERNGGRSADSRPAKCANSRQRDIQVHRMPQRQQSTHVHALRPGDGLTVARLLAGS